ncbi:hypothetical protein ASE38_03935 [Cellulomonas sp. Root930]|nr:hypothetical protein ASE38_03935 [Cellulomonas sp. Root930]
MRTTTVFDRITTTTFDDLADVPDGAIRGLLYEFGESALAEHEDPTFARTWGLWRAVNASLTAASAGDRPGTERNGVPGWLDRVIAFRLDALSTHATGDGDFRTIRILERRGFASPPHDDTYTLALVGGLGVADTAATLRADPQLLATELWRIFEVEGGGEVSLTAVDKYSHDDDNSWAATIRLLVASGDLDRDRVLDATLAALDRDFSAFRAGWFSRLWVSLEPTADESAARQSALRSLLRSDVKPTVALAVTHLRAVAGAGRMDDADTARALGPAALAPVKGTALAALRLVRDLYATGGASRDDVVHVASEALGHTHADVQRSAATLLVELGARDVVASMRAALAPSVAVDFVAAAHALPEPEPATPADFALATTLVPTTGRAVTEQLSALLEDDADVIGLELVLAGLSATPDADLLSPLRARAVRLVERAEREGQAPAPLRSEIARLVLRGLGEEVCPLPLAHSGYLTNATLPVAFLTGRMDELADVLRGHRPPSVLLATPEDGSGSIRAATLVERLTRAPEPAPLDLVAALLRLHPGGRAEALAAAAALPAAVRYALGGAEAPEQIAPGEESTWVAAGRARSVTEVDPVLLRSGLGGPGRAHPIGARVRTSAEIEQYDDGRGVRTWTSWRWELRLTQPLYHVARDQPTGMRQLGRGDARWRAATEDDLDPQEVTTRVADTWSASFGRSDLGAYVGWAATIWPADAEHFLVSTAGSVLDAAISTEVEYDAVRVLDALGAHPGRLGHLSAVTLAAGLAAGRQDQRVHAVDAVDALLRAGRLRPEMLAEGVTSFGGAGSLVRTASSWKDLASISPQASALVVDTLTAALPDADRAATGMHAVLAVLEDELLRAARPTPATLQPWLRGFTGSSRAARTAGRLASR